MRRCYCAVHPHLPLQTSGDRLYAIHLNFPRVIEQNVARLDSVGARALIDNLSEKELSDLAQLYVTANADTATTPNSSQSWPTDSMRLV